MYRASCGVLYFSVVLFAMQYRTYANLSALTPCFISLPPSIPSFLFILFASPFLHPFFPLSSPSLPASTSHTLSPPLSFYLTHSLSLTLPAWNESQDFVTADYAKEKGLTMKNLSGTKFRQMLRAGDDIPTW